MQPRLLIEVLVLEAQALLDLADSSESSPPGLEAGLPDGSALDVAHSSGVPMGSVW
ncbi:hypothetical protein [Pseudomonas sp. DC3000-4b1]|uniref:hypothetical protein n=1 Tax=Pseudomonas sp. DC3000-4b1 TaxID=2804666 RepID=UPI003CEF6198